MSAVSPIPVAVAARRLGLPERSLYRAVEKRRVPSTKSADGVTLVRLEDAAAWAAGRTRRGDQEPYPGAAVAPAAEPAHPQPVAADVAVTAPAAVTQASGSAPVLPVVGGDLAAAAVAAFDSGATVKQFCQQQRIAPDLALAAWRKVQELEDAGGSGKREDRVHELEKVLVQVRGDLEFIVQEQDRLAASLAVLATRVAEIHVPPSVPCVCKSCGSPWTFGQPAQCPNCGQQAVVGVPPRE